MKDVTTGLMMFHMDLFRNCENTPTVRICDPVKNEAITMWLDETKQKKREAEDEAKRQMDEYRRNKKKQIFYNHMLTLPYHLFPKAPI